MLDNETNDAASTPEGGRSTKPVVTVTRRSAKRAPRKASAPAAEAESAPTDSAPTDSAPTDSAPAAKKTAKKATKKTSKKSAAAAGSATGTSEDTADAETEIKAPAAKAASRRRSPKAAKSDAATAELESGAAEADTEASSAAAVPATALLFKAPEPTAAPAKRSRKSAAAKKAAEAEDSASDDVVEDAVEEADGSAESVEDAADDSEGGATRRRRRRGGRRRRKAGDGESGEDERDGASPIADDGTDEANDDDDSGDGSTRRRRRRRRAGEDSGEIGDDPQNTVTRVRKSRNTEDQITAVSGSTRLEAKKQRRREGREAGRRRAPIVSEAEFLARRESVERVMVVRQREDLTQIAVLEDKVLVEHYVARESQTSLIGNVYLGRVQNVLPSMEAAFIDIGKGRNAVLYAGEVNWSGLGHKEGQARKIESVLTSGQSVLVQVTKDPVGHKGARLTSQVSLAGRFLVYVPDGTTSGISRKLPDTERNRLKTLLKDIVPDTAGVIVRTAAEGASEEELTRDVERLKARWEDIEAKAKGSAPQLLYGEPDLTLKVVRDLFTEDFTRMVIQGEDAWDTVHGYITHVAPDLGVRMQRFEPGPGGVDAFAAHRIDEQIAKGLDRKVWLPSGGSLVIDRTEAMTVVDVNTGKFTGSGGNLEETVTKNNLEAADEIVRQLRLRDIGGIIVIDFIDMVLESNRDLVLRRLVECLGRDRTRHQVAEVTSLGLVQMTRKRIGTGLLEAFSQNCEHCAGRGVIVSEAPIEPRHGDDEPRRGGTRRARGGRSRGEAAPAAPSPMDVAAVARPETSDLDLAEEDLERLDAEVAPEVEVAPSEPTEPEATEPEAGEPQSAEPETAEPELVESEPEDSAPRVVTRTRRRAASRPAGPPTVADEPGALVATEDSSAVAAEHDAHHVEHVPIKKRGSRKR